MQKKVADDTVDPSEFEEPELYESMKILKRLDNLKRGLKKGNLHALKKCTKKEKKNEKERIKSKLKRPYLDLEKMIKVNKKKLFYNP